MKKSKIFVNDLKIRMIFPFYIDNINHQFFGSIKKYNNRALNKKISSKLHNLEYKEIKKMTNIEYILDHNMILLLINRIIKKIVGRTGTKKHDLFVKKDEDKNNQPIYVAIKKELYDFKIIGNIQNDRRYIYAVDINKYSYLFKYVEQIQFSFYLDEKNKMVSGGVSWNWGNDNKLSSTENVIENVYISSLIKYFISRELKDISLNNLISILEEVNFKSKNKKNSYNKNTKNNIDIKVLKESWNDLVNKKIYHQGVKKSSFSKHLLDDELFYSILITMMVSLAVCEELKIYFRHKNPAILQPLLKRIITQNNNDDQDYQKDFDELLFFLKKNYFEISNFNLKKILDEDDAIQALIEFDKEQNLYLGKPILSYEIIRNSDIPFLDEDDDVFMNNDHLKALFLMTMEPKMFGIHESTYDFIKFHDLNKMIKNIDFQNKQWNEVLDNKINNTICEWNYDYVSFMNVDLTFLIIKNDNPINFKSNKSKYDYDANRKLFNNYLWAQIYANAIIYKIKDKEQKFNLYKKRYPFLMRRVIYDVEKLHFDWYDDFYGLSQLKKIIKKIDDFKHLNKSITFLNKKIKNEDKLYGKKKERQNIAFAFITASMFGLTDFLTTVYTILTVQSPQNGLKIPNIIVISVGAILVTMMLSILFYTIIVALINKHKKRRRSMGEKYH